MGNSQNCGFGVLNNTQWDLVIGLSMAATHYYENRVRPGEIFYRWPGAVWYTVYVYLHSSENEMTDSKCALEIVKIAGPLTLGAIATVATAGVGLVIAAEGGLALTAASTAQIIATEAIAVGIAEYGSAQAVVRAVSLLEKAEKRHLYADKKGCYGGGNGTWLIASGGPNPQKEILEELTLKESTREEIFKKGSLTSISWKKYHT